MTSGASGLQLLLTAASCGLSSLASQLPAVVALPKMQYGWTSIPKADSWSHDLVHHHYAVITQHTLHLPHAGCFTRKIHVSQQQALTLLISSKYLLVTKQRTLCHYALPGATRIVEGGFGRPPPPSRGCQVLSQGWSWPSVQSYTIQLLCSGLDDACPGLFWVA